MNNQTLFDVANRLARLEFEMQHLVDCKGDIYYARKTASSNVDSIIKIYDSLKMIHERFDEIFYRLAMIENAVFAQKK